jgi:hypothetical protein
MEGWTAFFFTAGGLMLGWALTPFSGWLQKREEHKRVYRHVLFQLRHLFELRKSIAT